ncbi:unnamed protein product, partial [Polarella glacialis]
AMPRWASKHQCRSKCPDVVRRAAALGALVASVVLSLERCEGRHPDLNFVGVGPVCQFSCARRAAEVRGRVDLVSCPAGPGDASAEAAGNELLAAYSPSVVVFGSTYCGPCK